MSPQYTHIALALEILKLLAEKPRYRQDLVEQLYEFLDSREKSAGDLHQKVSRAIRKLRDCGFAIESSPHRPYELVESRFPVILSTSQREALYMAAYFLADMGFSDRAGQIFRLGNLSEGDRPTEVKVDFSPPADYSDAGALAATLEQLQQRFQQQRRYTIHYSSSQGQENMWDLDRSELRWHNGVLYLFACVPDFKSRYGFKRRSLAEQNVIFRIERIASVGPASQVGWLMSEFPTLKIRYRMSGQLANYEPRRAREKVIERNLIKKYVDIETAEDCIFWCRQRLLQYGANVRVLEPIWFAEDLAKEWQKAARNYETDSRGRPE